MHVKDCTVDFACGYALISKNNHDLIILLGLLFLNIFHLKSLCKILGN